ncbi:MAG: CDP-diacylglycerol--glycerol-3-phosphate 3-phosphatidyltransferase [Oscillospiraceae bacterium]|nr:CDP-diacylglycerol--glycerol-3-phosphate 3-phosphatidyltransferase [Oscillospiraceae bacterium]
MKALPNIISIFRIILVPVFVAAYIFDSNDVKYSAIIIYAVAGLSDFLDGFIARKFNAQSRLGKLLDPLADKLMTFTAIICITVSKPILLWAVIVFFVKELCMGIGGLVIHKIAHVELPPSNMLGKISTAVFFLACGVLLLFTGITDGVATIIIAFAIGLTLVAFATYIYTYIKVMKSRPKKADTNGESLCNRQSAQDAE